MRLLLLLLLLLLFNVVAALGPHWRSQVYKQHNDDHDDDSDDDDNSDDDNDEVLHAPAVALVVAGCRESRGPACSSSTQCGM